MRILRSTVTLLVIVLVMEVDALQGQEPDQQWQIGSRGTVSVARANLRREPALDAPIVTVLIRGIGAVVLDTTSGWLRVRADGSGREGWVRASQMALTLAASDGSFEPDTVPGLPVPMGPATQFEQHRPAGMGLRLFVGAALSRVQLSEDFEGFRSVGHTGAVVGAELVSSRSATVAVGLDGAWVQSGWGLEGRDAGEYDYTGYKSEVASDYLRVGPILRLRPRSGPITLMLGGYLAAPLSCTVTSTYPSELSGSNASAKCDSDDDWQTTDYGASVGAEVSLGQLSLGARYEHGLKEFKVGNEVAQLRSVRITVGYALR